MSSSTDARPAACYAATGSWRCGLRLAVVCLVLAVSAWWSAQGAHPGWSQDRIPVVQIDEITGLSHTTYLDRFRPGVDVLGGVLGLGALLLGLSFFPKQKPSKPTSP